ncbi:MAG: hypothetical protein ACK5Y2_07950 [Bdellovibrionales bacterium]
MKNLILLVFGAILQVTAATAAVVPIESIQSLKATRSGFHFAQAANLWKQAEEWPGHSNDGYVLKAVRFSPGTSLRDIKTAILGQGGTYYRNFDVGPEVLKNFFAPSDDRALRQLETLLRRHQRSLKFYHFYDADSRGSDWTVDVLIIIDDQNQAYGFEHNYG